MSILDRVRRVVAEAFTEPLENISAETQFDTLDDSLSYQEMILGLEDEFDLKLEIPDNEVETFFDEITTVGQMCEYIQAQLRG